jgi:hypothetical protein
LRIEIPKGSYRPQYRLVKLKVKAEPRWWWLAGVAGLGLLSLAVWMAGRKSPLEQLWGPMLESQQGPVLLVGQPLHVWVRDVKGQVAPADYAHFPDPLPSSEPFRRFAATRLGPGAVPVLHPSPNATLWGDAAGAASAVRFFTLRNKSAEMLPESTLKNGASLRGRPVVAFGRPEYSPAVQRYLTSAGGYTIGMVNEIQRYAVFRLGHPEERFLNTKPPHEVNHGLVTVLNDGPARVMVFSGITSDGSLAGLEYFTNEKSVAELFGRIGRRQWPSVFQVVLRVTSDAGYAVAAQYEKHLVLEE